MADVEGEPTEPVSGQEAAAWLSALSRAFAQGGDVTLPTGSGTVGLYLPDRIQAVFRLAVNGGEVEVENEFTWSPLTGEGT